MVDVAGMSSESLRTYETVADPVGSSVTPELQSGNVTAPQALSATFLFDAVCEAQAVLDELWRNGIQVQRSLRLAVARDLRKSRGG